MTIGIKLTGMAALAMLAGCTGMVRPGAQSPSTDTARPLLFVDGFDDGTLDRSVWNVEGAELYVNRELQVYRDSAETIQFRNDVADADGGVLVLHPVYRPGTDPNKERDADFVSGRINSKGHFDFTHGRAEARIKMANATGLWPAFWLLGNGEWPATGEIDIMEYVGDPRWTGAALHGPGYSGETPFVDRYTFSQGTDVTDWHVYAVEWTPDEIVFEVDGNPYYRVTRAEVEKYGRWAFDNPKYLIFNFALGGVYPHNVNGIEEPYFGMPTATAEAVKRGEVDTLVDWVRVYGPEAR